jgi:hypothetical protein
MTHLDCARAGAWTSAAEAGQLDEADALRLENHLSSCAPCRADRADLAAIGSLAREAPVPDLPAAAIDRALWRAIAARPPGPVRRGTRSVGVLAVVSFLVAGAAILGLARSRSADVHAPGDVVAAANETVRLTGVRVVAEAGTRLRVERSAVVLRSGRVRVAVRPGTPFSVRTDRFVALVAGTRFAVTPAGVEVWEGHVLVRSRAGALVADLRRGGRWRVEAPVVATVTQTAEPAPPPPRTASAPPPRRRSQVALQLERADSLRRDRRYADAAAAYHGVADRWPHTSTGEMALFTAIQIEQDHSPSGARRSLETYQTRYPNGVFIHEVQGLLRRMR